MRPRLLLLPDIPGWAFDQAAQNIGKRLAGSFNISIQYVRDGEAIREEDFDLIYVYWWGEHFQRKSIVDYRKIVKEISSHRWAEPSFGALTPEQAVEEYMFDAQALVATSQRLKRLFSTPYHYPLGVDPQAYRINGTRSGPLKAGWAGNRNDLTKRLDEIIVPACGEEVELRLAGGDVPIGEMPDFYNGIDVILIASLNEGTPLPLIEAMACGCFPITTEVGVAPEIIRSGENGLIVDGTMQAFQEALRWCQQNLSQVRGAGEANEKTIHQTRTWDHSAEQFEGVLRSILAEREGSHGPRSFAGADVAASAEDYAEHYRKINPQGISQAGYQAARAYYLEDLVPLLPASREARILEIGTGYGYLLRFLLSLGFKQLSGIDNSAGLLREAKKAVGEQVGRLFLAEGVEFLQRDGRQYDCIIAFDMFEHLPLEAGRQFLAAALSRLSPGGRLILRTPNMASLLGNCSLHQDLTHQVGYTEWTLLDLLSQAGFAKAKIHRPRIFASRKRKLYAILNHAIHAALFKLQDKVPATWYGKNLVALAIKQEEVEGRG